LPNAVGLTSLVLGTVPFDNAFQLFKFSPKSKPRVPGPVALPRRPDADDAASADASEGKLFVLTSGPVPPDPGEVVASKRLASALAEIADLNADYILVDAPPLLSVGDAAALSAHVDGLLMVTNLAMLRKPALMRAREFLDTLPCRKLGMVFVGERVEHPEYYRYKASSSDAA